MARFTADGPRYRAEQARDGSWTIYNVPIFSVHTDERGDESIDFDTKWLKRALKKGQLRHAEGYYPPLHIRHHGDDGVEAAGKIRFTHLALHPHGGEKIPTIFADLIGVRPEVYSKIRRGDLSYRSVEILDIDSPEIDSLALLDDEVPFFRYPLLRIGQERVRKKTPALAYRAQGRGGSILFRYGGDVDTEVEKQEGAPAWAQELLKVLMDIKGSLSGASKDADEEKEQEFGEGGDDEILDLKEEDEDEEVAEQKTVPTTLEPKDSEFPQTPPHPPEGTPTAIHPPKQADDEGDEDKDDDEEEKKMKKTHQIPYEVGVSRAALTAITDTVKSLRAEIEGLKSEQRVERQASQLRAAGVGSSRVEKFMATFRKHGEQAAGVYAQAIQEMNPAEPPRHFTGEITYSEKADPKVVSVYAQQGPEALERARSLRRSFDKTKPEMSLERYLQINMDPDAFFASARTTLGKKGA